MASSEIVIRLSSISRVRRRLIGDTSRSSVSEFHIRPSISATGSASARTYASTRCKPPARSPVADAVRTRKRKPAPAPSRALLRGLLSASVPHEVKRKEARECPQCRSCRVPPRFPRRSCDRAEVRPSGGGGDDDLPVEERVERQVAPYPYQLGERLAEFLQVSAEQVHDPVAFWRSTPAPQPPVLRSLPALN